MFLGAHGGAGVANDDRHVVGFVILDETVFAAKYQLQAVQSFPEGILEDRRKLQHARYFRFQTQLKQLEKSDILKSQKKKRKKRKSRPHSSTFAAHLANQLWQSGFQSIQTGTAAQFRLRSKVIHRNENDVARLRYRSEKPDVHLLCDVNNTGKQMFSLNLLHEKTMTLQVKHVLGLIKNKKELGIKKQTHPKQW